MQLVYPTASSTLSSLDSWQFSLAKTLKIAHVDKILANFQLSKAVFSQHQQKIEAVFLDNTQNTISQLF